METGSFEAKKLPGRSRRTTARKTDGLVMIEKRTDLWQQPLSLKELMLTLALKYQGLLFPEDLMK